MKIYIVNGLPVSGKDAFIDFCIEHLKDQNRIGVKISSVDQVKKAARMLGWDGEKDARGRMFLSDLKDLSTAAYDGPMKCLRFAVGTARSFGASALFLLIREPDEIAKFVSEFPETKTVIVRRADHSHDPSNHADANVENHVYDVIVENDKDLANLKYRAKKFLASESAPPAGPQTFVEAMQEAANAP